MEHEYTQLLTAASTVAVHDALTMKTSGIVHAPGPIGLPGGYPIQLQQAHLEIALPPGLTLDEAIHINQEGQLFDGIEKIDEDGTVYFAERNMEILNAAFGYECHRMPLSEVEERAKELRTKFEIFRLQYHQ